MLLGARVRVRLFGVRRFSISISISISMVLMVVIVIIIILMMMIAVIRRFSMGKVLLKRGRE